MLTEIGMIMQLGKNDEARAFRRRRSDILADARTLYLNVTINRKLQQRDG